MKLINDFLAYHRARKLERLYAKCRQQLADQVLSSEWFKRYGKYPLRGAWIDGKGMGVSNSYATNVDFRNIDEALDFINGIRFCRWEAMTFDLIDDAVPGEQSITLRFFNETSEYPAGVFGFYPNVIAEGEATAAEKVRATRAEELRYLREEADVEFFKHLYLDYRGVLSGASIELDAEERAAALANPRIAHLVE